MEWALIILASLLVLWIAARALIPPVTTWYFKQQALTEISAMAAILHTAKIGLYLDGFTPTEGSTYADITAGGVLPTYTGYVIQATVAWSAPFVDSDGVMTMTADDLLFQGSGAFPNTIGGWFMITNMGTHLLKVQPFDTPITLADVQDGITVDVSYKYGE